MTQPDPGLCESCKYARIIENNRGSRFHLCELSKSNPQFPRYPRLPVLSCSGYKQRDEGESAIE